MSFPRSVSFVVFLLAGATSPGAAADAVVLEAWRIYTGPEAPPIDDGILVLRDGTIAAVGPRSAVEVPPGAARTSCPAGVVTAGFQNSHAHFTQERWNGAAEQPAEVLSKHMTAMLTRHGFATVVDVGSFVDNTLALRDRIERGDVPGPRVLTAGVPIYPHRGIPSYLRSSLPPEVLAQLPQPASPAEAVEYASANFERGADALKLFVATPQGRGAVAYMPREIARAAAQEARRRGRLVFAHPSTYEGIRIAIDTGVDVLVHTTIEEPETVWDPPLIEALLANGVAVVPTLKLWRFEMQRSGLPQHIQDLAMGDAVEQLRAFTKAGGRVLFGTDVGYMSDEDPAEEYALMARALAPMEILASLTTAPAAHWKEEDRRGRVAVGQRADLVVLRQDPAEDAQAFAGVACTIRGGRVIFAAE